MALVPRCQVSVREPWGWPALRDLATPAGPLAGLRDGLRQEKVPHLKLKLRKLLGRASHQPLQSRVSSASAHKASCLGSGRHRGWPRRSAMELGWLK